MLTRDSMLQHQQRTLQGLLQYVWNHSSFYRDYYASYGIREKDLSDLSISDLPLLSKQTLMAHFDTVVTDPRLCKQELEQWIQDVRDPRQFYLDDFIVMHSSGSSGDVAIFVYDRKAWPIMGATVAKHLPSPEAGRSGHTRVAVYLASHGHFGGVTSNVLLPKSIYNVLILSLLDTTEHVVEQLNHFQPHRLVGYSSSVAQLAELALQGVLNIQPQSIIVSGDLLTPSMKQRTQKAWQAPIYEIYASSESIYLAIKAPGQEEMFVIDALNILEVLDQAHQPVLPGGVGRVVLTNLYNRYLPILRYELGDYVTRGHRLAAPYTTIQNIQGRVNDALPVMLHDGKLDTIHPIILSEFYVAGLETVQFISRRPDHIQVHYVAGQNIDDSVRQEFQRILDMKGAQRTAFEVQRVEQIEKDPQTGKLRLVRVARNILL
jgi:phenylacetate-CoA ligase